MFKCRRDTLRPIGVERGVIKSIKVGGGKVEGRGGANIIVDIKKEEEV